MHSTLVHYAVGLIRWAPGARIGAWSSLRVPCLWLFDSPGHNDVTPTRVHWSHIVAAWIRTVNVRWAAYAAQCTWQLTDRMMHLWQKRLIGPPANTSCQAYVSQAYVSLVAWDLHGAVSGWWAWYCCSPLCGMNPEKLSSKNFLVHSWQKLSAQVWKAGIWAVNVCFTKNLTLISV